MVEFLKLLFAPCSEISRRTSMLLDEDCPRAHRWAIHFHHVYCSACRRYRRQIRFIRQAMQEVKPDLQDCYEQWLRANPGLAGTLRVRFSIRAPEDQPEAEHATVQDIGLVASDVDQPLFEGCVMNAMQDMRFDVPADGKLDVTYPLRFSSTDAGLLDGG